MDIAKRHDCSTLAYDQGSGTFWLRGKAVPLEEVWRIHRAGEFTWIDGTYLLWFQCNFASKRLRKPKKQAPIAAQTYQMRAHGTQAPRTRMHKMAAAVLSVFVVGVVVLGATLASGMAFQNTRHSYGLSAKERMKAAQGDRNEELSLTTENPRNTSR